MKKFCLPGLVLAILLTTAIPVNAISIPEEKQVADKFMKMVKSRDMILHDPAATHMIEQMGLHLMSFIPSQPFDYSFYVVDDDIFNAFASPGANIFFYRGLITSLDSADELAGIMAHEIAHASSRHVSESIDRSKYINIGTLAGLLAGVIAGTQGNSESGAAIIKGSLAAGHTAMLAFTRENETEADEKGIMILKRSCFSPQGLLSGLQKIREADLRGIDDIPDYVKTHPGTGNRIAHAESILAGYKTPSDKPQCQFTFDFNMVKYRLIGLYGEIAPSLKQLENQLAKDPSNPCLHYGVGLLYDRKLMRDKAIFHLKKALSINFFDPLILVELGRIYLENEETQKALNLLESVESDPVLKYLAQYYLGITHLKLGHLEEAEKRLKSLTQNHAEQYPKAFYHLANVYARQKNPGLSHYYLAIYYEKKHELKTARIQARKATEQLTDPKDKKRAQELLKRVSKQLDEMELSKGQ